MMVELHWRLLEVLENLFVVVCSSLVLACAVPLSTALFMCPQLSSDFVKCCQTSLKLLILSRREVESLVACCENDGLLRCCMDDRSFVRIFRLTLKPDGKTISPLAHLDVAPWLCTTQRPLHGCPMQQSSAVLEGLAESVCHVLLCVWEQPAIDQIS